MSDFIEKPESVVRCAMSQEDVDSSSEQRLVDVVETSEAEKKSQVEAENAVVALDEFLKELDGDSEKTKVMLQRFVEEEAEHDGGDVKYVDVSVVRIKKISISSDDDRQDMDNSDVNKKTCEVVVHEVSSCSRHVQSNSLQKIVDKTNVVDTTSGDEKDEVDTGNILHEGEADMSDAPIVEEAAKPVEEVVQEDAGHVLQESDVEDFRGSSEDVAVEQAEEPEVQEEQVEDAPEEEEVQEEEQVEEKQPEYYQEDISSLPLTEAPPAFTTRAHNENDSPATYVPSEEHNPKRLDGSVWPPRDEEILSTKTKKVSDEEVLPKKRISDLIAKFNTGSVENEPVAKDLGYKTEYGASKSVGKVSSNVFH